MVLVSLLTGCVTPSPDKASDGSPTDDTSTAEPTDEGLGDVEVTVDGTTWLLELEAAVQLLDSPASLLTMQAATRSELLAIVVSDLAPLAEDDYPFGRWGEPAQTTQFAFADADLNGTTATARSWATDTEAKGSGTFTFDRLDRDAGLVSAHWSGQIDQVDAGVVIDTVSFEGSFVDLPLVLASP